MTMRCLAVFAVVISACIGGDNNLSAQDIPAFDNYESRTDDAYHKGQQAGYAGNNVLDGLENDPDSIEDTETLPTTDDQKSASLIEPPPSVFLSPEVVHQIQTAEIGALQDLLQKISAEHQKSRCEAEKKHFVLQQYVQSQIQKRVISKQAHTPREIKKIDFENRPLFERTQEYYPVGYPVEGVSESRYKQDAFFDGMLQRPAGVLKGQTEDKVFKGSPATSGQSTTSPSGGIKNSGGSEQSDNTGNRPISTNFQVMHASSPWKEGRSDPKIDWYKPPEDIREDLRKSKRIHSPLRIPPSPAGTGRVPESSGDFTVLCEKGVRIQFDQEAIAAAQVNETTLRHLEMQLSGATTTGAMEQVFDKYADLLKERLLGDTKESFLTNVTVISLRHICARAESFRDNWKQLPDDLQCPGQLRRVHGYVIRPNSDPEKADILIVGTSEGNCEAIKLDDLIVGLTAAWRDGVIPICSLDPDVLDITGPQRSVVIGIPGDSHFALKMLEADYLMKKITLGRVEVNVPGFIDLVTGESRRILGSVTEGSKDTGFSGPSFNRLWLTPIQPGQGEIRVSAARNIALFDAHVQILTEAMAIRQGKFVGTGRPNPSYLDTTRFMTENFREFEEQFDYFAELHGLFDVVLLGNLLRNQGIDLPVLHRLTALPRRSVQVPETYAGITVFTEFNGISMPILCGGVKIKMVLRPESIWRVEDPRVEKFLAGLPEQCEVEQFSETGLPIALDVSGIDPDEQNASEVIVRLIGKGDTEQAIDLASERIRNKPFDAENYALRAKAFAAAKLFWLADRDLQRAEILSSYQPIYRLRRLQLLIERGDIKNFQTIDVADRHRLAHVYLEDALNAANSSGLKKGIEKLCIALSLVPDKVELLATRARLRFRDNDFSGALSDLDAALEIQPNNESLLVQKTSLLIIRRQYTKAAETAEDVIRQNPKSAEGYLLNAMARFMLVEPLDSQARNRAFKLLDQARKLAPREPRIQIIDGEFRLRDGDFDGAYSAAQRALKLSAGNSDAYVLRAKCKVQFCGVKQMPGNSLRFLGEASEAQSIFEDLNLAVMIQPKNFEGRILRARMLEMAIDVLNNPDSRTAEQWFNSEKLQTSLGIALLEHEGANNILQSFRAEELGTAGTHDQVSRVLLPLKVAIFKAVIGEYQAALPYIQDAEQREMVATRLKQMEKEDARLSAIFYQNIR